MFSVKIKPDFFEQKPQVGEMCLHRITAFCFATLDGVAGSEWAEDVFVSPTMLNKIADWIVSTQRDDGAFPEVSTLIYSRNFLVSFFLFCTYRSAFIFVFQR